MNGVPGGATPVDRGAPGVGRRAFLAASIAVPTLLTMDGAAAQGAGRLREFVFLHGYTTPSPTATRWRRVLAGRGLDLRVTAPVAASGVSRIDPFNPQGAPSWFRYYTDNTRLVPQIPDRPDFGDVHQSMYEPSGTQQGDSLWRILARAVDRAGGAHRVAVAGESQGGIMAAFLAFEWNRRFPGDQLGRIGLIRSAPDPQTWQPRPEGRRIVDDPAWTGVPPRYRTRIDVVLGASDDTFRPYLSLYSLAPVLQRNPRRGRGPNARGNTVIRILPGVDHVNAGARVYRTYARLLARSGVDGRG